MPPDPEAKPSADREDGRTRFRHLDPPIRPEDMITTTAVNPPPDPTMGRDIEADRALLWS